MYVFLKTNFRTNPHDVRFTAEMSALGQKQTFRDVEAMSALPLITDIDRRHSNVCFVPIADITGPAWREYPCWGGSHFRRGGLSYLLIGFRRLAF
jgi:hypothetical protein